MENKSKDIIKALLISEINSLMSVKLFLQHQQSLKKEIRMESIQDLDDDDIEIQLKKLNTDISLLTEANNDFINTYPQ